MPDNEEKQLQLVENRHVYSVFERAFSIVNKVVTVPSFWKFTEVWTKYFPFITVQSSSTFTKYTACDNITASRRDTTQNGLSTQSIMRKTSQHIEFVGRERRQYRCNRELAGLYPSYYPSILVNGSDQTKFSLSHFATSVKD